MRICAYDECEIEFSPASHNQKYHSPECCRLATNKRIMKQYYENKQNKNKKITKRCKVCEKVLNRYNNSDFCSVHDPSQGINGNELLDLLGFGIEDWDAI